MTTSVREYAILYVGGKGRAGGGTAAGGNVLLNAGQHALDGPEHTGQLPADRVSYDPSASGLVATDAQAAIDEEAAAIAALASSYLPWSYARADGGLVGDGTTDDTVACQAWIGSVCAAAIAGGQRAAYFRFEAGTFLIGGALQDTGAFNGQILLPDIPIDGTHPQLVLHFQGASRPPFAVVPTQNVPAPGGYSIIKSTLTGASGTAAVISGGNTDFNNISVVIEDLICIGTSNPTFTFWNLQHTQGATIQDVMIWTTGWTAGTFPTHSNAYGIKLPGDTQGNYTRIEGLSVRCFYTGVRDGDLVVASGVQISGAVVGWERPAGSWPSLIEDIYLNGCSYGIRGTGGPSTLDVLRYSHEHYPSDPTALTVYDLDDPSDYITGAIRWWNVEWSVGPDHIFSRNGGANISDAEVGPLVPGGSGTVTSVAQTVPAEFAITGSPVTTAGTLAITKATQAANKVWAGPASGSAAQPTFRDLVAADLPASAAPAGSDHDHVIDVFNGDGSVTTFELTEEPLDPEAVFAFVAGSWTAVAISGAMNTIATFGSAPGSGTGNVVIQYPAVAA